MAGVILSPSQQHSLRVGIDFVMGAEYAAHPIQWQPIYEVRTSTKNKEEVLLKSGMGNAYQASEMQATPLDGGRDEWIQTFVMREYLLGFAISRIAIEDGQYMDLGKEAGQQLSNSFRNTKEVQAAAIFNNATSTARPYVGGDGVALLSAAHPLGNGSTFSNFLSGMQLSETALDTARIMIERAVDERELPIALNAKNLIIPPDLLTVAHRLLQSTLRPGTNENDTNWMKDMGLFGKPPVKLTRLVDTDAWFIQTDVQKGLIHYKRRAFSFDTDYKKNTRSYHGYASERYAFGNANPRSIFGSVGS
jgi:hypothetical protein